MVLWQITKSLYYVSQSISKHLAGSWLGTRSFETRFPLVFFLRSHDGSAVVDITGQLMCQSWLFCLTSSSLTAKLCSKSAMPQATTSSQEECKLIWNPSLMLVKGEQCRTLKSLCVPCSLLSLSLGFPYLPGSLSLSIPPWAHAFFSNVRNTLTCPDSKNGLRSQAPVAHTCNPSYSGGRHQEDHDSKLARTNSSARPYLEKTLHKKGLVDWLKV
jgi:hypothetical protein